MVDKNIVIEKLAHINKCLDKLHHKSSVKKEIFLKDSDIQDIVLHNLQLAIQGCVDIASHIISDEGWTVSGSMSGLFDVLKEKKVISDKLAVILKDMVGFRNIVIHEYEDIDMERVYYILTNRLSDFSNYLKDIIGFYKL